MQTQSLTDLNHVAVTRARGIAWATVDADCPGSYPDKVVQAIVILRGYGNDRERDLAAQALGVLNSHRTATCGMCSPLEGVTM